MRSDIDIAEMTAWADILSMIGEKNSRLYDFLENDRVTRPSAQRSSIHHRPGRMIIEELERERSRIARELHAGAGQPLAGIKMNLETLDHCASNLPPAGRDALERLQTLADQALQQVRAVSHRLHPPDWQGLGAANALRSLVQASGLRDRMEVDLRLDALPEEPSHAVRIALYRCAQECISNVIRHSGATHLLISLAPAQGDSARPAIELRAEDNGRGFTADPSQTAKGIGLRAMREHATDLGGSCDVASSPEGVRVCVRLPLVQD